MENKKLTSGMLSDMLEHDKFEVEPNGSVIILTDHDKGIGCHIQGKNLDIQHLLFYAMLNNEDFYNSVRIALMVTDKAKEKQAKLNSLDKSITQLEDTLGGIISMCENFQKQMSRTRKRNQRDRKK